MQIHATLFAVLACSAFALEIKIPDKDYKAGQAQAESHEVIGWDQAKARRWTMHGNSWKKVALKRSKDVQTLRNQSIIFYGDSIVEHWSGESQGQIAKDLENRPKMFQKYFVDRYGPSHIAAIGGDRIPNLLWRLQNGESPALAQPRLIILHIGTNDLEFGWNQGHKNIPAAEAAQKIFSGYQKVVEEFDKTAPHSAILLTSVFPRHREWPQGPFKTIIPELNKLISSLADGTTIHYADCSNALLKEGKVHKTLSDDFLHPSDAGSEAWAECLQPTIDRILLN